MYIIYDITVWKMSEDDVFKNIPKFITSLTSFDDVKNHIRGSFFPKDIYDDFGYDIYYKSYDGRLKKTLVINTDHTITNMNVVRLVRDYKLKILIN